MELKCNSIDEMVDRLKDRRIICWGIGNYFDSFIDTTEKYWNSLNIVYLIDNKVKKQNKKVINEKKLNILSFIQYCEIRNPKDVIIITTVHYNAIIEQIKSSGLEIDYLSYALIPSKKLENKIEIRRSKEILIPPLIHYCWFGKAEMPQKDKRYVAGWKKKCPDYKIMCWNEENFDIQKNSFVKWAYRNKKWAFVSDYVRMYALYYHGGIYLDTDVELVKNLDELRYQYAYMGMEQSGCVASGLGMGTVQNNPYIKEVLESYERYTLQELKKWDSYEVNAKRESDLLRKHGFKANNEYQIVNNIAIFPSEFFSPVQVGKREIEITENTYSIHHYHYSWLTKDERESIWEKNKNDRNNK